MYKLLIVDDEYIVRQGLRKIVPWNAMGVLVAGEAGSVEEAVKTAAEVYPDIIICDIRLPGGEGFEAVKQIQRMIPWAQFIMITAYSDQQYLLQAIHSGVCDYLFKPAKIEDIQRAVQKACDKIDRYHMQIRKQMEYQNFVNDNLEILRERFICDLLRGKLQRGDIEKTKEIFQIQLDGPYYMLLIFQADTLEYEFMQKISLMFQQWKPTVTKIPENKTLCAVILNCIEKDLELKKRIEEFVHIENLIYKSEVSSQIPILNEKLIIQALEKTEWKETEEIKKYRKHIFEALKYEDAIEEIMARFEQYDAALTREGVEEGQKQEVFRTLLEMIEELLNVHENNDYDHLNAEKMRTYLKTIVDLRKREGAEFGDIVDKALYYLRKRYQEDVSLEQVAAELFISSSYLSRTIKERTGKGFQKWLTQYRIEAAIIQLNQTEKGVEQIAEECGYHSYRIFSEHFRKYTGDTATQYRQNQRKEKRN